MQILIVILGIVVLLLVAWLCSENRKAIRFRTVGGAFAIQALFAAFILYVPLGEKILLAISNILSGMLNYSSEGINFLFGNLGQFKMGFVFAVHVLPIIIFMSALFSVLYYLGIMQWIIRLIGTGIHKLLRTSPAESMAATANIFAGNTDVFVLMKPYAPRMTRSELFALMTGGVASIAGWLCQHGDRNSLSGSRLFYVSTRRSVNGENAVSGNGTRKHCRRDGRYAWSR